MNWYYADGANQVGPITEADLDKLIEAGTIRPETLVWREGMANWQPCSEVKPSRVRPRLATFPPPPVIVPDMERARSATVEEVSARDYELDLGDCVSRAWETYKSNFGVVFGATILILGLTVICGIIPFHLGPLAQLIVQGPLMGGLYGLLIKKVRGEEAGVSEAFSGFGPRFVSLMLTNIVSGLLACLCVVPAAVLFGIGLGASLVQHHSSHTHFSAADLSAIGALLIPVILLFIIGFCAAIYLTVGWVYSLALVVDKRMGFWSAMSLSRRVVGKHWWMTFAILFVGGLIAVLGVVGCGIGILFTIPIPLVMTMHLYEQLFGDLEAA